MIELPLSIVAWLSVVLVQAVIHYVVLGSRRNRIQHEEDLVLEESLSLATTEESLDDQDVSFSSDAFTIQDCGYQGCIIPATPGTPKLLGEEDVDGLMDGLMEGDEPQPILELLTQTGTELLKVSESVNYRRLTPTTKLT
jgi:hypothetical protein